MPLTDKACKNAKGSAKLYRLFDSHGLYLEVTPAGGRYWRWKYRYFGKERRFAFGVYPEVSLAEVRDKLYHARKLLSEGVDPAQRKKDLKRTAILNMATTFELVAREWYDTMKGTWGERHALNIMRRFEMDIFPEIGARPIKDIVASEVLEMIRKIEKRGALELARRATQMCGQVFRYAIITDRAESDPSSALKGALKPIKKGHFAAFDVTELPKFLYALNLNNARLYPATINAVKFLMLTFVRTSELVGATWNEFDLENAEWSIPAERMKMRRPHIVPLSKQALAILKAQKETHVYGDWVFPNQVSPRKHMSNCTILGAIKRLGYKGEMTGHGFRALAMSTIKEKLGYRHEVIDRQLAHAPRNRVDAAYDRAMFLDDRRIMMQEWADYLDKLAEKGKVISANANNG
ncbi:MAG: tyrosine-type recombinase/integrase [Alphaproteobacteria bacterium]|nr:tyrosine-type recombinase/integrase [Alphaproteobacteria bacterium]